MKDTPPYPAYEKNWAAALEPTALLAERVQNIFRY